MKVNTPEQRAAKRSRRLRKKMCLGEFAVHCTVIKTTLSNSLLLDPRTKCDAWDEIIDELMDELYELGEKHSACIYFSTRDENKALLRLITEANQENLEAIVKEVISLDGLCDSAVYKAVDANYTDVLNLENPEESLELI